MSEPTAATRPLRQRIGLRLLGAILAATFAAAPAGAGSRVLRWTHEDSSTVAGFRVHLGSRSGFYERIVTLGRTAGNENGVYSAIVDLGDGGPVYVAVTAYDRLGRSSALSNERSYSADAAAPVSKPGTPLVE